MKKIFLLTSTIIISAINIFSQSNTIHQSLITIKDAWVRPAAKDANSALYFVIQNNGNKPDTLIDSQSKLAEIVEIHETYKMSNDRIGMRQVKFVAIPPKLKVEFKVGEYHVMLLNVKKDFRKGEIFEAVLLFKHFGKIKVKAAVNDTQPQTQ